MTETIEPGSRVIVTRPLREDEWENFDVIHGHEYVVDRFAPEGTESACYILNAISPYVGEFYAPPDALKVTASAEEVAKAMAMPELDELAAAIASALHSMWGDFEVEETHTLSAAGKKLFEEPNDFTHGVEFYARRPGGVTFGGVLRLTGLWKTDA